MRQRSKLYWSNVVCRPCAIVVHNVEPTLGQRMIAIWVVDSGAQVSVLSKIFYDSLSCRLKSVASIRLKSASASGIMVGTQIT